MPNNYSIISPFYDAIKTLVFGKTLIETEIHFLKNLESKSLLVIGSGSAEFLNHIEIEGFEKISLIDKNPEMLSKAKNRIKDDSNIEILNMDILQSDFLNEYDYISLPFFLDCLNDSEINLVLERVYSILKPQGKLIISDFFLDENSSTKSRFLTKLMYQFFSIATNINRSQIPDYKHFALKNGFRILDRYAHKSVNSMSLFCEKI